MLRWTINYVPGAQINGLKIKDRGKMKSMRSVENTKFVLLYHDDAWKEAEKTS